MANLILEHLKRRIKARGFSIKAVGEALDPPRTPSWFSKALLDKRRLWMNEIDQSLDIIGEPVGMFWKGYLELAGHLSPLGLNDLEPAYLLRMAAGDPLSEAPEPVASLLVRGLPRLEEDPLTVLPLKLRQLDDLRMVRPETAKAEVLAWIGDLVRRLQAQRLKPAILAELITALGAYATVLRSRGQSRLAARTLATAFEAGDSGGRAGLSMASLLWRSAPVLTDAGYPKLALSHLRQARDIFFTSEQTEDWIGTSLSLGAHHFYLGDSLSARRCFEQCLGQAVIDEGYRLNALSNLAKLHEHENRPEEALELVERLQSELPAATPSRFSTTARWIKGRALGDLGDLERAAEELSGLRHDVARYCTAIDPLLLFCDYASVLLRLGDDRRLRAAAEATLEQLPRLKGDSSLFQLASEALEPMLTRAIRVSDLRRLRRQVLEKAR